MRRIFFLIFGAVLCIGVVTVGVAAASGMAPDRDPYSYCLDTPNPQGATRSEEPLIDAAYGFFPLGESCVFRLQDGRELNVLINGWAPTWAALTGLGLFLIGLVGVIIMWGSRRKVTVGFAARL